MTASLGTGLGGPLFAELDTPEETLAPATGGCDHEWDARWQCEHCATDHPALGHLLTRLNRHLLASQAAPGPRRNIAIYLLNSAVRAGKVIPDTPDGAQVAWEWLIRTGGKLRLDNHQLHVDLPRVTY